MEEINGLLRHKLKFARGMKDIAYIRRQASGGWYCTCNLASFTDEAVAEAVLLGEVFRVDDDTYRYT